MSFLPQSNKVAKMHKKQFFNIYCLERIRVLVTLWHLFFIALCRWLIF
jgi:hypothetical protein